MKLFTYESWCERCARVTPHAVGTCTSCHGDRVCRSGRCRSRQDAASRELEQPSRQQGSPKSGQWRSALQGRPHDLAQSPRVGAESPEAHAAAREPKHKAVGGLSPDLLPRRAGVLDRSTRVS